MELVAMHLRKEGVYMCRTLSFSGCKFFIHEGAVEDKLLLAYDQSAVLWQELHEELLRKTDDPKFLELFRYRDSARDDDDLFDLSDIDDDDDESLVLSRGKKGSSPKLQIMRYFWGAHQGFFKTLCMSLKLQAVVRIAKAALAEGKAVVIGLQSTGQVCHSRSSPPILCPRVSLPVRSVVT